MPSQIILGEFLELCQIPYADQLPPAAVALLLDRLPGRLQARFDAAMTKYRRGRTAVPGRVGVRVGELHVLGPGNPERKKAIDKNVFLLETLVPPVRWQVERALAAVKQLEAAPAAKAPCLERLTALL